MSNVNLLVSQVMTESARPLSKEEIDKLLTPECTGKGENVVCKDFGFDEKADRLLHLGKFAKAKK